MNDIVKTARIIGLRRFLKTTRYLITDRTARDKSFFDYPKGWDLSDECAAARRALGLPDNWAYNEADLRAARTDNLAVTFFAVNHLVLVYTSPALMEVIREQEERKAAERAALRHPLPALERLPRPEWDMVPVQRQVSAPLKRLPRA